VQRTTALTASRDDIPGGLFKLRIPSMRVSNEVTGGIRKIERKKVLSLCQLQSIIHLDARLMNERNKSKV